MCYILISGISFLLSKNSYTKLLPITFDSLKQLFRNIMQPRNTNGDLSSKLLKNWILFYIKHIFLIKEIKNNTYRPCCSRKSFSNSRKIFLNFLFSARDFVNSSCNWGLQIKTKFKIQTKAEEHYLDYFRQS